MKSPLINSPFLPTARILILEEEVLGPDTLKLNMTVNGDCPVAEYPVLVTFGSRPVETDGCVGRENVTNSLSPGQSITILLNIDSVCLRPNEEYCYIVSLNGAPGELYSYLIYL